MKESSHFASSYPSQPHWWLSFLPKWAEKTTATEEKKTHSIVLSNGNLTADNSELAALNADCANLVTVQRPRKILMTVSLGYKEVQLMLENTSLFARDAKLQLSSGEKQPIINIVTYRGTVLNEASSTVSLCANDDVFALYISTTNEQWEIHKQPLLPDSSSPKRKPAPSMNATRMMNPLWRANTASAMPMQIVWKCMSSVIINLSLAMAPALPPLRPGWPIYLTT